MSSAARLPVSYNVSTYGDASRDYTSLAAWEADTDNDLVSAGMGEGLEIYADVSTYNDTVQLYGATTNADYFRFIRPAEGHVGAFKFSVSGVNYCFNIYEKYSQIQNITVTGDGNHAFLLSVSAVSRYHAFVNCIADNFGGNGFTVSMNRSDGYLINCLAYGCNIGFYFKNTTTSIYYQWVYNCTAVKCDYGFYLEEKNYGTLSLYAKNCISEQNNTANWGGVLGNLHRTTCTDGDGVLFRDPTNDDYRLSADDTVAKDQGTDLSADSVYAFADDLFGIPRPRGAAWDIGAYEYSTAPNTPTAPSPENNQVGVAPGDVTLSCTVSDPDGDTLDVSFYDASDDSLIGEDTAVPSGDTASVIWPDRGSGETYSWYAVVDDGQYTVVGNTWTFTTASMPQGQVYITFKAKKPTMTFTAKKPSMAFTARKPTITFDV